LLKRTGIALKKVIVDQTNSKTNKHAAVEMA